MPVASQMEAEGVPRSALIHIDHLLTNYRMDVHGNLAMTYGAHDPGCCSLGMRALSLTMLGDLDQVEVALRTAVDLAYRIDHKPSLSQAHMFCAENYIILNRTDEAEAHLNICIPLAEKYSLANYLIPAKIMQGWVRGLRGEVEAGVQQAEAALETLKSFPSRRFHLPFRIGIVGLTKAAAGDIDGALALFVSALEAGLDHRRAMVRTRNCFVSRRRCCSPFQSDARTKRNNASKRPLRSRSSRRQGSGC